MPRYRFPASKTLTSVARGAGAKTHPADVYPTALEKRFPHILNAIVAMWGYQELNVYFQKLSVDERGGREGFPIEVWEEINMLLSVHQAIFPPRFF